MRQKKCFVGNPGATGIIGMEEIITEIEKVEEIKKENKLESVLIEEIDLLKFQLINSQFNLVKKSIENLDVQKQVYLLEHQTVVENYNTFKKDIKEKYLVDFDEYTLDMDKQKLIKKDIATKSKK